MAVMNAVESCHLEFNQLFRWNSFYTDGASMGMFTVPVTSIAVGKKWRTHIRARPSLSLEQPVRQAQSVGGHGIECRAKEKQTPEAARAKI
ncbi:hypothetical protein BDV35DRAFT_322571 [Aspergillus flavus]|uniref:Uncharacterized protein n=1 Tax=Aspergillus flavus TaxID=5059 RepID=A0A5N6GNP5_ASPFL|nr:hypothetical protein BDV35DRAFT_322571 [Aspergillus flavus]